MTTFFERTLLQRFPEKMVDFPEGAAYVYIYICHRDIDHIKYRELSIEYGV